MKTRKLGSLSVSEVGLGCNNFGRTLDAAATANVVHAALDAGINFFDTADIYGQTQSEVYLGQAVSGRRGDVIIATKFGAEVDSARKGAKPAYIKQAIEDSLRRLNTDYIDLYQLHTPDETTPIADTLGALNDLVKEGKVREIGCSNFTVAMLQEAEAAVPEGGARFVSTQNHFSLFHRESELPVLAECEKLGIGYLPYFPLANGLLTGKYRKGQPFPQGTRLNGPRGEQLLTEQNLTRVENLISFAESKGHTILELAFAWLLKYPVISSVIAGATSETQIRSNAAAANWQLSDEEFAQINTIMA